ncbi:MAG: hypothetical protein ACOYYS_13525 [Chloroflexota bacterium]
MKVDVFLAGKVRRTFLTAGERQLNLSESNPCSGPLRDTHMLAILEALNQACLPATQNKQARSALWHSCAVHDEPATP